MAPERRQTALEEQLLAFEDPQERLAFVQDRVRRAPVFPPEDRSESNRIHGCQTRVWLRCRRDGGKCYFEVDSESAMVRGLAALFTEVYSGAAPEEVLHFECAILERVGLARRITPTRLHGLRQLEAAIKAYAGEGGTP